MSEEHFNSLNRDTGLIEDINEVRELGIGLANFIIMMVNHPLLQFFIPEGAKLDAIALAVSSKSMMMPMSQADYMRALGNAAGERKEFIEFQIRAQHLSEVLPTTHPDAPKTNLPPLDPNDPVVRESIILSELAKHDERDKQRMTPPLSPEEHVRLSDELEAFLSSLGSLDRPGPTWTQEGEQHDKGESKN